MRFATLTTLTIALGACSHTSIASHPNDECGEFESSDTGLGIVVPPGDQYQKYSGACATRRTVEVIAAQREAVVRAAWGAAAATQQQNALRANAPEAIANDIAKAVDTPPGSRRLRIAVYMPSCNAPAADCLMVRSRIESALVRIGNATIIEHARTGDIARERMRQQSDIVDDASAVRLGRELGASHVLLVEVAAVPSRTARILNLSARCIAVETGEITAATSAEFTP